MELPIQFRVQELAPTEKKAPPPRRRYFGDDEEQNKNSIETVIVPVDETEAKSSTNRGQNASFQRSMVSKDKLFEGPTREISTYASVTALGPKGKSYFPNWPSWLLWLPVFLLLVAADCTAPPTKEQAQNASPTPPVASPSVEVPSSGDCVRTGCSREICTEKGNEMISTCLWFPQYECYKSARCEKQASGRCGWAETHELKACLEKRRTKSEPGF